MKTIIAWRSGEVVACVHGVRAKQVKRTVERLKAEHGRVRVEVCDHVTAREEIEA